MKHSFLFTLCLAGLTALTACSTSDPEPEPVIDPVETPEEPTDTIASPADDDLTPTRTSQHYPSAVTVDGLFTLNDAQQQTVSRYNDFAMRLLKNIRQRQRAERAYNSIHNIDKTGGVSTVISPLSMTLALAFAADGATGETQSEIWRTLGLDGLGTDTPNAVNEFCATIIQNTLQADTATRFNIANAFYLNSLKHYTMNTDYVSRLHAYYDADIETLDFSQKASCDRINDWCRRQTDGMIPSIIEELDADVVAYLLNAIFMEGRWQHQFQEEATTEGDFEILNPNLDKVLIMQTTPMMHQKAYFPYYETDAYQAIRMNYGNGTYGMTVILPKPRHDVDNVLDALTTADLRAIASSIDKAFPYVDLTLPRFTIDLKTDLKEILSDMGIREAFSRASAGFNNIVNESDLYISNIFQKARIEVAEKGTRAAAITVIEMFETADIPHSEPEAITFRANIPFLYFITERRTGIIYFMGIYGGR